MAQPAFLLVGLGNPGSAYRATRHNIGFLAVDRLATGAWQKKFKAEIQTTTLSDQPCILMKPQTFMNLSGEAVGEAVRFYKLDPAQVIVLHDDLDLVAGKIKVKQGGGHGGHNGLKSIDAHIGPAYWRVRLGIGHPGDKAQVTNYVLGGFDKADQQWLDPLLDSVTRHLPLMLAGAPEKFMSAVARAMQAP